MGELPTRSQLKEGMSVSIVATKDTHTGKRTVGIIRNINSRGDYDSNGIMVVLNDEAWTRGRVKEIISTTENRPINLDIPNTEDMHNEFKQTFGVPVDGGKANDIKFAVAKEVAAFWNAKGGRLFIGVHDDGHITGLKKDLKQHKDSDKLESAIRSYLGDTLDKPLTYELRFAENDEYLVIHIPIRKKGEWVYIDGEFFVREGNRAQKYTTQRASEYQRMYGGDGR